MLLINILKQETEKSFENRFISTEIAETSEAPIFEVDSNVLVKLLAALNECSEWGQGKSKYVALNHHHKSTLYSFHS